MKSKKILTILLSLAIMFTFMPAMAFAEGEGKVAKDGKWNDSFTEVSYEGTTFKAADGDITYEWNASTGVVTATVNNDKYSPTAYGYEINPITFYDLTDAKLVVAGKTASNLAKSEFSDMFHQYSDPGVARSYEIYTKKPSYATSTVANKTYAEQGAVLTGWNVEVKASKTSVDANSTENEPVDVVAVITFDRSKDIHTNKIGSSVSTTYTFLGAAKNAAGAKFFFDVAGTTGGFTEGTNNVAYDGAAHSVVMNDIPGYTATYSVLNMTTGKYDEVSPSITNVGDEQVVQVVVSNGKSATNDGTNRVTYNFTIGVSSAAAPSFGFEVDPKTGDPLTYKFVEGTEVDPFEYLLMTAGKSYTDSQISSANDTNKALYQAKNAADESAAIANEALLREYIKEFYEAKVVVSKADPSVATMSVARKSLTNAERRALNEKYKALRANFNITGSNMFSAADSAEIKFIPASTDYEVTFTKAITSKTFKGSKTTKKGKLKKNQTIQFTAEAANGKTVKYKLINVNTSKIKIDSATGKLTVKKGLAKGTYSFKVKAYVPGSDKAFETQSVKIKVKK